MKDLLVTYKDTTITDGRLQKGFNNYPSKITGTDWILQKITKHLLTEAGTNFYNQTYGTHLGALSGRSFRASELDNFKGSVVRAIAKIEKSIVQEQILQPDLTEPERLKLINVDSIFYNQKEATMEIFLKITMITNDTFRVRV